MRASFLFDFVSPLVVMLGYKSSKPEFVLTGLCAWMQMTGWKPTTGNAKQIRIACLFSVILFPGSILLTNRIRLEADSESTKTSKVHLL